MHKNKKKIVIDTSIFVNPESRKFFGNKPHDAFNNFLVELGRRKKISCFIPPSVYQELENFTGTNDPKKIVTINKKPPSKYQLQIPAIFFYQLIEETRDRVNKGLRIAEKYSRRALGKKEEGDLIKNLRHEYRIALREGILDSREDCDLVLLAQELNAYLATSDNGLIHWAQKLGINCISAAELKALIS
jgi:hypothetical protein